MPRIPRIALSLLAVLAAVPARAQEGPDTTRVQVVPVARGVWMLVGRGGNIGVSAGADGVFLVDDQYAPLTGRIRQAVATISDRPIRFVLNTHWHGDHTGGNENFGREGVLIVAHDNVRRRMSSEQFIASLNRREPPSPRGALPVVTFAEGVTFHLNGDSIVVTHMPAAHTDGDAIVHFAKANVIHAGDAFNTAGLPFVDLSSGGSIHGVIRVAERILSVANAQTRIIPGHGPVTDREKVRVWRDALIALRDRVKAEVAAGKTVEQVLAMNLTAPYAKDFAGGHERFVRLLHQELSGK